MHWRMPPKKRAGHCTGQRAPPYACQWNRLRLRSCPHRRSCGGTRGRHFSYPRRWSGSLCEIAGRDAGSDLAVLKLERAADAVAEVTKSPARLGQIALALGRPSPDGIEASLGTVSAIGGPIRTGRGGMLERYIRTDSISYPGFSGGPLVAADGTILGLNTSGLANGAAVTIPADIAWRIADTLVQAWSDQARLSWYSQSDSGYSGCCAKGVQAQAGDRSFGHGCREGQPGMPKVD